jgi:hypothetical protein
MSLGERVDRGGNPRGIEEFGLGFGWCEDAVHDLTGYRTIPALSRDFWLDSRSILDLNVSAQLCSRGTAFEDADFLIDLGD